MQSYMKSSMPYAGVSAPGRKQIFREALASHRPADADGWQQAVLELMRGARVREEWYLAMELYTDRRFLKLRTPRTLPILRRDDRDGGVVGRGGSLGGARSR